MIILKHLTVEHFRLLREIDLHFPQRGSILIQGPNEAGKSTLFESIYFALYGEALASESRRRTLDDLVFYGATDASVTLMLSIDTTDLTITRSIERGKGQKVALLVRQLGLPQEIITDVSSANERILAELAGLNGEILRNSCFVEQKALTRLENLRGSEREATLRTLLGLEKLIRLTEPFKVVEHDEQLLTESAERLKLAEVQTRIPKLSKQLGDVEAALDAITVSENLDVARYQEAEIDEQELALEQVQAKRLELKSNQGRVQQLKKADALLTEIIAAYDAMADAQQELPELEQQIANLERREREELPILEKRVHDLEDLTRSFGTLERLGADLLAIVSMIKELEQELKEQKPTVEAFEEEELDEQIARAQAQIEQIQQTQHDLDLQYSERPQLEERLQRLQHLSEQLTTFRRTTEQYTQQIMRQGLAEENSVQLTRVTKELHETEQELVLVEAEAEQAQQRADAIENRWRQLSIRRQLEEWQRLRGLSHGLVEAEQHVRVVHQQQEQLTRDALAAQGVTRMRMIILIACSVVTLVSGGFAILEFLHQSYVLSTILGIVAAFFGVAGVGWSIQNYSKAREREQATEQQQQHAISQVGMMVAAREAAARIGGRQDALVQIEHEIRSLGGTIPRSPEDAQRILQQMPDQGESLADIQQQMTRFRTDALTARNQVNVTIEATAALRKEIARLEEQGKQESFLDQADPADQTDQKSKLQKTALEQAYQQVASLVGQEGLPLPNFESLLVAKPAAQDPFLELTSLVETSLKDTERLLVTINARSEVVPNINEQIKVCQKALDTLRARKRIVSERRERFQTQNPQQQIERAREQQATLRDALRSLQDSLRQRVQPMGIPFGQTTVHNAEIVARKQLEALHIDLGRRVEFQSRRHAHIVGLKDHQESLAEHYRQLAKFSTSLGSWIVPLNPFTEALIALRTRCQQELQAAQEESIIHELDEMQLQEGASQAKIALCRQEIEEAYEGIAAMLAQHGRPSAKGYNFTEIVAVWPLVGQYSSQDRPRLQEERNSTEEQLHQLEQQEMELSEQLHTGGDKLDLEQARMRMELQERNYQTKKRAGLMVQAVSERMMRKMLPRIEHYMQQLVTLLTCGRYRDVHLTSDPEEGVVGGGSLQVRVWESAAGAYLPKSALSGGTADQLSLALRLAFASAALPRELTSAPGFMLLDEPLNSLDRAHTQALIDVVTGEMLGQHFEQIVLISHSSAFDPARFPYHISLDGGLIVETNLPTPPLETNDSADASLRLPVPLTSE